MKSEHLKSYVFFIAHHFQTALFLMMQSYCTDFEDCDFLFLATIYIKRKCLESTSFITGGITALSVHHWPDETGE